MSINDFKAWACATPGQWYYAHDLQRQGRIISDRLYRYIHR